MLVKEYMIAVNSILTEVVTECDSVFNDMLEGIVTAEEYNRMLDESIELAKACYEAKKLLTKSELTDLYISLPDTVRYAQLRAVIKPNVIGG